VDKKMLCLTVRLLNSLYSKPEDEKYSVHRYYGLRLKDFVEKISIYYIAAQRLGAVDAIPSVVSALSSPVGIAVLRNISGLPLVTFMLTVVEGAGQPSLFSQHEKDGLDTDTKTKKVSYA